AFDVREEERHRARRKIVPHARHDAPEMDEEQLKAITVGRPPRQYQEVVVADYDPIWPHWFESAAFRIREALGDKVLQLDHAGSVTGCARTRTPASSTRAPSASWPRRSGSTSRTTPTRRPR